MASCSSVVRGVRGRAGPRAGLALLAFALALPGCGGGGGGGSGGGGGGGGGGGLSGPFTAWAIVDASAVVVVPTGAAFAPSDLKVSTIAGDVVPAADGTVRVPTYGGGPSLAMLSDADGDPVLAGFVPLDPQATGPTTLDARSTAEFLAFQGLGVALQEEAIRAEVIRRLHATRELDGLAAAVASALVADPKAVAVGAKAISDALAAVLPRLRPFVGALSLQIGPTDVASGIQVFETGIHQIIIRNTFRRRAVAFVDQVSYTAGGTTVLAPLTGDPLDVAPTVALNSILGATREAAATLGSMAAGMLPTASVDVGPIDTPVAPQAADRTQYLVTVLGPGSAQRGGPSIDDLTPERHDAFDAVCRQTFFLDLLLPWLSAVAAPQIGEAAQTWLGGVGLDAIANEALTLKDTVPAYWEKLQAGDSGGAFMVIVEALVTDSEVRKVVIPAMVSLLVPAMDAPPAGFSTRLAGMLETALGALKLGDGILTVLDTAAQMVHIDASRCVQTFDVTATRVRVRLTPTTSTITKLDVPPVFHATVPDASDAEAPLLKYRFRCTGTYGHLVDATDAMHSGNDFETSSPRVAYAWDQGAGTDTITVEALIDGSGSDPDVSLGTATATVTVVDERITITPETIEMSAGDVSTFYAKVPASLANGRELVYRWTTTGRHGGFTSGVAPFVSTRPTASFRVLEKTDGEDTVSVEVFWVDTSSSISLGTADATIEVTSERPHTRVLYGSGHAGGWTKFEPPWVSGAAGFAAHIPKVEGVASYAVRCYGFNDGFWGTQRFANFTAAAPTGVTDLGEEYELGFSGISWFGPAPSTEAEAQDGLQSNIASYDARFAGMIVEVTVTYDD